MRVAFALALTLSAGPASAGCISQSIVIHAKNQTWVFACPAIGPEKMAEALPKAVEPLAEKPATKKKPAKKKRRHGRTR